MESPSGSFEDIVAFIGEFSHDPLGFVYATFPWGKDGTELASMDGPDEWQKEILADIGRGVKDLSSVTREAVASGHGIGKSALVAWIILWSLATHEDTRCVVTANTDTQLRSKTWAELAKWYRLFIGRDMFCFTAIIQRRLLDCTTKESGFLSYLTKRPLFLMRYGRSQKVQ